MALDRYRTNKRWRNPWIYISKERNMFVVAERFISNVVKGCGEHPVSTDGGTWYPHQACKFLKLNHHIHFCM
jgi:putative transposase